MTRERLLSFTIDDLRRIALREGYKGIPAEADKDTLVDIILEAMDESRGDRELLNSPAMRVKGLKYDIFQDEELVSSEKEEYPIPAHYNDTRIVLLLRDPQWAFAYWDVNDNELKKMKEEESFKGLLLRVYELNSPEYNPSCVVDYFDIPVSEGDDSWYINLLHIGRWYRVDLVADVRGRDHAMCHSTILRSPTGYLAENQEEFFKDSNSAKLILSSLWNYGEHEQGGMPTEHEIPQRIIGIMDSYHLKLNVKAKGE